MPITHLADQLFPEWCELRHYDVVSLQPGVSHSFTRREPRERLIVAQGTGTCRISYTDDSGRRQTVDARVGTILDLGRVASATPAESFAIADVAAQTVLVRMCGYWGKEVASCGIFTSDNVPPEVRENRGDPVDYEKTTAFDSHWHDCDEYWIAFEGRAEVVSEGRHYLFEAGDCIITGMWHHHDIPRVMQQLQAVFFETTLHGRKRRGHLWDHTHGPAQPSADRK